VARIRDTGHASVGLVPWVELQELVEPHYPKGGNGRPPVGLSIMLRVYFRQQWFT
jgi:IS5 family transposase